MTHEMEEFIEALREACTAMAVLSLRWDALDDTNDEVVQKLEGWQDAFLVSMDEVPFIMHATLDELEEAVKVTI